MAKTKLTKSAVDAAQPQAQPVELRDILVPSFMCKVTCACAGSMQRRRCCAGAWSLRQRHCTPATARQVRWHSRCGATANSALANCAIPDRRQIESLSTFRGLSRAMLYA